jgi:hypothetical protein
MKSAIENATTDYPILKEQLETLRDKHGLNDFIIGFLWGAYRGVNNIITGYKDGKCLIDFEKFIIRNK